MKTRSSTIHLPKTCAGVGMFRAAPARGLLLLLLSSVALNVALLAAPLVSNNDGSFFDDYGDSLGLFSASQVRIAPVGAVSLTPPNTSGNFVTVEIVPSSFAAWGQLTLAGTYGALNDVRARVLSQDGLTELIAAQPVNVPINLSGLDPVTVPGLRVQVLFNKTTAVAPTVDHLRVTWTPVSKVLLDKQGPVEVRAGENLVYLVRYSVSYIRAQGLVVWDTLPHGANASLIYPPELSPTPYPLQSDNVKFVSATKGGQFHAGPAPLLVDGVLIPTNSVYWRLGNVEEGVTDLLNFTVTTRDGTLSGTVLTNYAFAAAANAAPSVSGVVVTAVRSEPKPSAGLDANLCKINGVRRTLPGLINTFDVSAFNRSAVINDETMYRTVLYDDVSGLLGVIDNQGTPGVPADDFFGISAGGAFVANYTPPGGAVSFPAIVWAVGALEPGRGFNGSFSVRIKAALAPTDYTHRACVLSEQTTTPACDELTVRVGLDDTLDLPTSKKATPSVPPGGVAVFQLIGGNKSAVTVNDILIVDRVPTNTIFRSAWFDDPALVASGAVIFYSTSVIVPQDWNTPPPTDFTQAPGDLDAGPNTHWARYDLQPPANPAAVTWVAFYFPRLDPNCLPGPPPPVPPVRLVVGYFDATVFTPPDPCVDGVVENQGLFAVNAMTPSGGGKVLLPSGPIRSTRQTATVVEGLKTRLFINSEITPILPSRVLLPGAADYSLAVANTGTDALGNVQAVVQLGQVLINGVLQYPTVLGLSPAGTYDAGHGRITFALGLMGPRTPSKRISVQLALPAGIIDRTEFVVSATVTGQGALCGPVTATTSARGQVESSPKLKVFTRDVADLIPSGAEYDYELEYVNVGTAPSTRTWVVVRVPNKTVLVRAYGHPNITAVWFSTEDSLPPQVLTPGDPITGSTIANQFTQGLQTGNTWTPDGSPSDLIYWVAWEVDDAALNPPQLILNAPRTVGFTVRNDDDGQGAGTAGSPDGTLLFNAAGIFSSELLQAIGNRVITTIRSRPSIIVQKSGPSVVEAGVPFNWVVNYYNNSLTPAQNAVVTDTLPPGVTLLGATHTWNAAALANGASVTNSGRPVPTSVTLNGDGSTTVTFLIAGATGYRGNGVALGALEGGTFTLAVTSDPATASGTTRLNLVCGTADTAGDPITSCDEHQVTIFRPDLELSKYASPATVLAGGTVTYQLVLANRGPIRAREVALVDQLPAEVSYVAGSLAVLTPGYTLGAPAISGQTLSWNTINGNALTRTGFPAGEIPGASGNILIQFNVQVGASVPGCTTLNNCAQISTVSVEEGVYANAACAVVTVPPPELAVAKSGPALARPGNRVSWNLSWANESAQAASGVYLVDALLNNNLDANSDVTFVGVTVPAGVTAYYHAGPLTLAAPFNPLAPLSGGWTAAPVAPVNRLALLVGALAGNAGPFSAQVSVDLIDPVTRILPPPGISFTNTVVIAQAVPLCENTANNTATAIVRTPSLDVALTKTGSVEGSFPGLAPGAPITYTLAFANSGTVNAYGVRVVDTLPATLTPGSPLDNFTVVALVDGTGQAVAPVDLSGNAIVGPVPVTRQISGGVITWFLGTAATGDALYYQKVGLPPGSQGFFQLHVTVTSFVSDGSGVCNAATVFADVGLEELLGNNTAQSCTVARRADVAVKKSGVEALTGDANFVEFGALVRYTISYNNLGSLTADDVVINEFVPRGTSLVSVNPPPGSTVTYAPDQANATSFSVRFATLTAPANSVRNAVSSAGADVTPPTLDSVGVSCATGLLTLLFSEPMNFDRATSLANYHVSGGVTIQSLALSVDGRTVRLGTSPLASTNSYVLTVSNLTDVAGNTLASNAVVSLQCPTAPIILVSPTNQFVEQDHPVTFTVVATGGLPLYYQWRSNSVPVPGATNAALTLASASLFNNGSIYQVTVSNSLGVVSSAAASLIVVQDTTPPVLLSATVDATGLKIYLTWNEAINPNVGTDPSNFYFTNPGLSVILAERAGSNTVLTLDAPLAVNTLYTLHVDGQLDLAGNSAGLILRDIFAAGPGVNCCGQCAPSEMVTNVITVQLNYNFLIMPPCMVTSNTLLSSLPLNAVDGDILFKWNAVAQTFTEAITYIDGFGWFPDNATLSAGEGFGYSTVFGPRVLAMFTGCPLTCPLPCAPLPNWSLVGALGTSPSRYTNLYSCPPACGTVVSVWDTATQSFTHHTFGSGGWTPQEPVIPAGASAFVFGPPAGGSTNQLFYYPSFNGPVDAFDPSTNCFPVPPVRDCLGVNSNGVYEASASAHPDGFLGWKTLFVEQTVPAGTSIRYSVGRLVGATAVYDLGALYTSVSVGVNGLDLSGINPAYSNLVLRAEFAGGSGTNTSCFKAWQMTYDSARWPSFDFTVRVDGRGADSCGPWPVNNVVSISTTTPEISVANNTASYALNTRLTDLTVAMSVNKAAALVGETLIYTLNWSVLGPQSAPDAYLQVALSEVNLDLLSAEPGVTAYFNTSATAPLFDPINPLLNGWTTSPAGANHIVFLLGDLAANRSGNIIYTAVVRAGTVGRTLISTVTGRTTRRETDCDNSDSVATYIGTLANVFAQMTGPGCVHPGDLVTFKIHYGNNGNTTAVNAAVSAVLPAGLTFVSSVPFRAGPGLGWTNIGTVPGRLSVGETGTITLVTRLANDCTLVGKTLINVATIRTTTAEVTLGDNRAASVLDCITADTVSLNGFVFHDRDNDGAREPGASESGLPDVVVTLTGTDWCGSLVTRAAVTERDGAYSFTGLNPGTYTLTETQPATWASTADTNGTVNGVTRGNNPNALDNVLGPITLAGGENGVEYNFGENYLRLGNLVWRDDNNNGARDTGEPGLDGVTVQLWSPGTNGIIGGGDDLLQQTTATAGGGFYQFTHLLPGQYFVRVPAGNFAPGGILHTVPGSSTATILTDPGATGADHRDAGAQPGGRGTDTTSPVVTLALGLEAPATVDGDDFNGMQTLDFGFNCGVGPTINCPPPLFVACASAIPAPSTTGVIASASCGGCGPTITVTWAGDVLSASNCVNQFVLARTYRATDGCGNSATCQQLITVSNSLPPVLICATNKTVECGSAWSFNVPVARDACGGSNVLITIVSTSTNGTGCAWTATRTWEATDPCGHKARCSQTVTVRDTTPCAPGTFTFSGSGDPGVGSPNIRTFTTTNGVTVKVSAFSRTKDTGAWAAAYVGLYSAGLGVTDTSEDGSDPAHTVDNVGRDNFLLFEFSQPVVVDRAYLGFVKDDSDLNVWIGTFADPFNNHLTLNNTVLAGFGLSETNNGSSSARWADLNAGQVSGNAFIVSGRLNDTKDQFKINKLEICKPGGTPPTPPPCVPGAFTFSGSGPDTGAANIRTFTATNGVTVKVSAFSRTKDTGAWAAAYVGLYSAGLGITDPSEDGSDPAHTVDNVGRDNFLLFEFSQPVTVDRASLGFVDNDSDLNVWIGTFADPFNNHLTLNNTVLGSFGFTEANDGDSSPRWADLNAGQVTGNAFLIAARLGDTKDQFKINKLEICSTGAVVTLPSLPSPWSTKDLGAVGAAGSASFAGGQFTVIGSGADIGGTADEFRFAYQTANGDCSLVARVVSLADTDSGAKAGVMIRESLNANAKHASTFITPGSGVLFQYRTSTGGSSSKVSKSGLVAPYWLKVTRSGNTFTSYRSANGSSWTKIGSQTVSMSSTISIGLVVTSGDDGTLCPAVFDNVTATP